MSDVPSGFGKPRLSTLPSPRQLVKRKLRAREPVLGINPEFAAPEMVEFCARLGAELIFIDCEHGGPDVEKVSDMVRAAHVEGAAAVLRPWSKDAGLLRHYIDAGIDGLIAPDVQTAEEVRAISAVIADSDPHDVGNFILITLIESELGYNNLSEMLATGLVDAVLVGSGDLAVSLGLPRRGEHEAVREMTFGIVRRARDSGVSAGAPLNRYGVKPTIDAGGNLVMFFARDLLRDGLAMGCSALSSTASA